MVLKLEQIIGSKNSISVLRHLILKPHLSFGLTEISEILEISKSNILRISNPLIENKIILEMGKERKKKYRINPSHNLNKRLYEIFMLEKQSNLMPETKNAVDLLFSKIEKNVDNFILFGSAAYGFEKEGSDIDILTTGKKDASGLDFETGKKIEIHHYRDFSNIHDFVVLEAIMNGICYKGNVFDVLCQLDSLPKSYFIYRLKKAKEFMDKAGKLNGPAKSYFMQIAKITFGEISSIMSKGTTLPKIKIVDVPSKKMFEEIENNLAKEGEKIWIN